MAVYEDINLTTHNFIPEFIGDINNALTKDGIQVLGLSLLLMVGFSILISAKRVYSFWQAFVFAAVVNVIITGLLVKLGYLGQMMFYMSVTMFVIAMVGLFIENKDGGL